MSTTPRQLVAPTSPGSAAKLRRAFCTVLLFTLLGPIIAGIAIYCVGIAIQPRSDLPLFSTDLLFSVVFVSVIGGVPPAFSIGAIVAVWEWVRQPTILAPVVASVVGSIIFYFAMRSLQPSFIFFFAMHGLQPQALTVLIPVSLIASVICWLLTARLCRTTT
jgi:ABC-type uncharacterized transport system permease subunit